MLRRMFIVLFMLGLVLSSALPSVLQAQTTTEQRDLAISSSVLVLIMDWKQEEVQGNGSGTLISADGLILTNNHVVSDDSGGIASDGSFPIGINLKKGNTPPTVRYLASVVARSEEWDLALLQIEQNIDGSPLSKNTVFPFLPLGDSDLVEIEDSLRVIGFPGLGGNSVTLTRGIVAGFESDDNDLRTMIKTDTEISPGNSGGTAINDKGQLIGVPTSIMVNETGKIGHVRPINIAKSVFNGESADQTNPANASKVTVTGKIISADTKKPISGALIGVLKPGLTYDEWDGGKSGIFASAQTDRSGAFTLNNQVDANVGYTLVLQAKGYQSAWEDNYILADDNDAEAKQVIWTFKLSQAR